MSDLLQQFKRYPRIVLAAYLAQLAEQGRDARIPSDLKALAEYHAELRDRLATDQKLEGDATSGAAFPGYVLEKMRRA